MQMLLSALPAWLGAFVAALALALLSMALRWRWLGGVALGVGVLAGWWWVLGSFPASPRQLAERLPILALVALGWTVLGLGWRRAPRRAMAAGGALAAGWWMAGAPLVWPDLVQSAPELAAVAGYALLALRATRISAPLAALVMLAGLLTGGPSGPAPVLAAVLLAAALGAAARPWAGALSALPFAAALAALAALPVLARGAALDWAIALLPLVVLLLPKSWRHGPGA